MLLVALFPYRLCHEHNGQRLVQHKAFQAHHLHGNPELYGGLAHPLRFQRLLP